ncbi:alpha-1,3/1,6-mannosyltransferase ALG2 [Pyrus ussuriensis x Pyrus communis]|uniref:Alpha-1,3/1,6-mannosyltransferase ALG2 n=1 Tax=Pyrus ussuriensis x Pyrus communis TaxID=2448454 RepID=A0A5N5FV68_9ROSA|nr:alpha-1,3/1,6-mannosyltransferase ALG2 [Pyrus ussuriensis x Pyrus communis]
MLVMWPSFDVILADQVSVVILMQNGITANSQHLRLQKHLSILTQEEFSQLFFIELSM